MTNKRKYYVTVVISNPLLKMGKLENYYDSIKNFILTLDENQKANHTTFTDIIMDKFPHILDYPSNDNDKLPKSTMKIISWSLIEE